LTRRALELFADAEGGFYLTAEGSGADLIVRVLEDSDNVEPCASSVMTMNFLRLEALMGQDEWRVLAEKTLRRFGGLLGGRPMSLPYMAAALGVSLKPPRRVVFYGRRDDKLLTAMLAQLRKRFLPATAVFWADPAEQSRWQAWLPFLAGASSPAAYVCAGGACGLPLRDVESFTRALHGTD
jgi:uncharacterized protein YyaL (SSP411 family)